jgi:hypothetical protein
MIEAVVMARPCAATGNDLRALTRRAARADPDAREFLREADPVLARLIDARPGFRPRAWIDAGALIGAWP